MSDINLSEWRKAKREKEEYDGILNSIGRDVKEVGRQAKLTGQEYLNDHTGRDRARDNYYVKTLHDPKYREKQWEKERVGNEDAEYQKLRDKQILENALGINNQTSRFADSEFNAEVDALKKEFEFANDPAEKIMSTDIEGQSYMTPQQRQEILAEEEGVKDPKAVAGGGSGGSRSKGGSAGGGDVAQMLRDLAGNRAAQEKDVYVNPVLAEIVDQSMKRKGLSSNLGSIVKGESAGGKASDIGRKLLEVQNKALVGEKKYELDLKKLHNEALRDQYKANTDLQKISSTSSIELKKIAISAFTKMSELSSEEHISVMDNYIKLMAKQAETGDESALQNMREFAALLKKADREGDKMLFNNLIAESLQAMNATVAAAPAGTPISTSMDIIKSTADEFEPSQYIARPPEGN